MSVGAVNKQTGERIPTAGMPAIDDALDLTSVNPVQNAIITAALANKQDKTDNALQTTDKTVVGAINEHEGDIDSLKSGFTALDNEVNGDATTYPYADVITVSDAVPANLADCSVKIEPVQDLHGYDKPWVGGAGKNKANLSNATLPGVSRTVDISTGTVTLSGTASESGHNCTVLWSGQLEPGTYVFSAETFDGTGYQILKNWNYYTDFNKSGSTVEVDSNADTYRITKYVNSGTTVNVTATGFMIRLATETDATFAPYTNICPISGHTEAVVTRDGRNLIENNTFTGVGSFIQSTVFPVTGDYVHRNVTFSGSGAFTFKLYGIKNGIETVIDEAGYGVSFDDIRNNVSQYDYIRVSGYSNDATNSLTNIMVAFSDTDTPLAYVPYAGQTYTLALGDTIYGGTLHIDNKGNVELLVDRVSVDMGTLPWGADGQNMFRANITGAKTYSRNILPPWKCEVYPTKAQDDTSGPCISSTNWTSAVCLWNSGYSDAASVATALSGKLLVYELATPLTVQLTHEQIQLLQGTNTLYASTGDISVTVNGVSGAIGAVQEQVNDHEERIEDVESDLVSLFENICSGVKIKRGYKAYDADVITFDSGYYIFIAVKPQYGNSAIYTIDGMSTPQLLSGKDLSITQTINNSRISLSFTGSYMNFILVRLVTKADFTDEIHLTVETP